MSTTDPRPPVLFLMGPTASGKTALAVELVKRQPFAIISVDSALVYRGMTIGAAKPDAEALRIAPHRLIDFLDPSEAYSAGQFRHDALREIAAIQAMGRIPLLVGGTLLYFRALERGLAELPTADPAIRARLAAEFAEYGSPALHARLAQLDPVAAARIHPHDPQRIQRALEVRELTGRSLTELCAIPHNEPLPFRIVKWIVAPTDRQALHERIAQRFQAMLDQGLIAEVAALRARGDLCPDLPSMRAVGYRQVWAYLDGKLDEATMIERAIIATRQFAKRQLTWLRAESGALWLDSLDDRLLERAMAILHECRFFPKTPERLC
ncbi:MAG: tRNA (adenosine(37)-N6)-dimethylallyltransferase MiaA [Candidatus Contendobacter sp.]|jgi:tRNA dimethylallyltransferase|nr:tRNA (adenosine(37)-N6)-dimethylallyltransferase MiaA [Gammaproteobacteria bacterium]MCC8993218.1 tRNA (adenosine(37)-N6)-dimethylallyltransferase MiaA [Candidatus Contendobacter sp.]